MSVCRVLSGRRVAFCINYKDLCGIFPSKQSVTEEHSDMECDAMWCRRYTQRFQRNALPHFLIGTLRRFIPEDISVHSNRHNTSKSHIVVCYDYKPVQLTVPLSLLELVEIVYCFLRWPPGTDVHFISSLNILGNCHRLCRGRLHFGQYQLHDTFLKKQSISSNNIES